MSGRDERKILDIPNCPSCEVKPKYWTLGRVGDIPLCWLYSREYSLYGKTLNHGGKGTAVGFARRDKSFHNIERRIVYAWCAECRTFYRDMSFVQTLIDAARKLENIKYEE